MRVAFLTHEPFYPPSGGGSAEAVYLVEELRRRGHEIDLFCPAVADGSDVERRFGVRLHEFKGWRMGRYASFRNVKYLLYPARLAAMVQTVGHNRRFDVLLSQHAISAVAAGRASRVLQVPAVMNFLDYLTGFMETWPPLLAPPPLLRRLKEFELSIPLRYSAAGLMTVSDTLADRFVEKGYPREQLLPIYYGFDARLFPFQQAPPQRDPPVVVMHGSLDHHHLGPIALQAVATVTRARPGTLFRFVGHRTATVDAFLARVRRLAPEARTEVTGFVPYSEVAGELGRAAVGIIPYEESTGTHCAFVAKLVEYLGVGLPVVSTPLNSAMRYFQSEPMIRFTGFDGDSFGKGILDWLNEPPETRTRLAPIASERVRRELDWGAISRKAIDFTEKIAQRSAR
jgi:glycosyltransferase involved in cell wall biosynthesis